MASEVASGIERLTATARELIPEDVEIARISTGHLFVEGPVWDARAGAFLWSDIAGDTIWRCRPAAGGACSATRPASPMG